MKSLLIILTTAGVAFASAFLVVNRQQATRAKQEVATAQAQWQKEKTELEAALAEAKGQPAPNVTIAQAAPAKSTRLSPKEIIEKLAAIHPGTSAERPRNLRLVVFYLESLVEWNAEAVPDIKVFLARNEDVDYTIVEETPDEVAAAADQAANQNNRGNRQTRNNRGGGGGGGNNIFQLRRGGEIRTDFILPPSLRLGLVDVLRAIGGDAAEKVLAHMLETTGRGIEVAYLARVLEQLTPGKYQQLCVTVAKDLLTNPPVVDGNSQLDENSKGYLYGVLAMFNDTSFAANAQNMLIGTDGRIDRSALNYLNTVLKEQAVPTLYAAYQNPSLTNQFEKANIARDILNYAGNNQTANQLLSDIVKNEDLDARMRSFAIIQLAGGGFGPFGTESPTDPQVIAARTKLAQSLLASTTDETIARALTNTIVNLNHLANGEPIENVGFGRGGGRGAGGPGRNRNGGGGGGN